MKFIKSNSKQVQDAIINLERVNRIEFSGIIAGHDPYILFKFEKDHSSSWDYSNEAEYLLDLNMIESVVKLKKDSKIKVASDRDDDDFED